MNAAERDRWARALADLKDAAHAMGVRPVETDRWSVIHSPNGAHQFGTYGDASGFYTVASVSSPDALRNLRVTLFSHDARTTTRNGE